MEHQISQINKTSNSYELCNHIKQNMYGSTFHLHYHILNDIINYHPNDKLSYLEIGSFCGGSLSFVIQNPKISRCYSIDPMCAVNDQLKHFHANLGKFNVNGTKIKTNVNYSTNPQVLSDLDLYVAEHGKFDILFIDGDHSYNGVLFDFNNYNKYVNYGGYIVFDDYQDKSCSPEVKPAVDDLVKTLNTSEYEIIGSLPNNSPEIFYGDVNVGNNEFILRKL